jgi:acyl-CoA synthetase (AMP-forming)/AMP-acid ligase II
MGLIGNAIQPLYLGSLCVLMSPIDFIQKPVRWLRAISQFRATTSGGPNFAYDLLCRQVGEIERQSLDLSSLDVAFLGAEPVRLETMARFAEIFSPCGFRQQAFYPCYGMAEATLFISGGNKDEFPPVVEVDEAAIEKDRVRVNPLTEQSSHHFCVSQPNSKGDRWRSLVSCGHPWLNGRVAIADPHSLTRCRSDRVGEIWVATAGLGQGYWQQPQETERTFHAYLRDTGEGPFLRTGDLGFIRDGEIFITGRLHDVMVFFGLNHYPQHIEETIQHANPAFRHQSGAAFSVEVNGESRLVIAQEVNRRDRHRITVAEVVEPIRWAVFERHFIDVYSIVLLKPGVLPKTPSGKIQRGNCRTRFLNNSLPVLDEWRSPTNQIVDIPTLVRRYLNPLTHLKRYIALAYTQVNLFLRE